MNNSPEGVLPDYFCAYAEKVLSFALVIQILFVILHPKEIIGGNIMATAAIVPTGGQIIVNIENISMLRDIKKAISMVRGVTKVTVPRTKKRLSSYERSLRDLDEGRVYEYDSLDDLIKEIEG